MSTPPSFDDIKHAYARIKSDVKRTPIVESSLLNEWMGNRILFKAECLQTIGAFKLRGAMNFLARLKEEGRLPKHVVANSSGNHAQAVAYAATHYGCSATIFASETISPIKAAATQSYGAELKLYPTRPEADAAVEQASKAPDTVWIPPFNHEDIVAGQGTVALEALNEVGDVDAVFAPCGGGGLLSGTLLATRELQPNALVIGAEPAEANDASMSLQAGEIVSLQHTPNTLADGAATPSVGDVTFPILQELDDFYEVDELQIAYWTQWLHHLLKLHIEPTCAMTMAAVAAWAANTPKGQTALVIISGGNISQANMAKIWERDFLLQPPILDFEDADELEELKDA
ncbi:serine/threonine dehydratase [Alteromonas sp. ALT199]|uniref:serine/threonine dehydratase n=1 Tax=unclassified Alteromonas TaxID=2614992 RepID=UPI001BE5E311|nr:serine/threonine dehydratase [Alteromonas sp. ALT199]MBT3134715.1 serine/threonine dehydratase [Alteromonas sp. ALT199]